MAFCRSSPAARPTKLPACEACAAATATGATKSYALCRTQPRIKMRKCPTVCSRSSSSSSLSISSLSSASVSSCFCCLRLSTASSSRRSQRTRYTRTMRRSTESRRRRWRSKALQDYLPTEVPTYLVCVTAPLSVRTEAWLCSRVRKILVIIDHFRCFFRLRNSKFPN